MIIYIDFNEYEILIKLAVNINYYIYLNKSFPIDRKLF